jgi:threonyl-tRNA synthetase
VGVFAQAERRFEDPHTRHGRSGVRESVARRHFCPTEKAMLSPDDHRQIGQKLDLFHFQEEAPGMVFWHPRGYAMLSSLRAALARVAARDGFEEVLTPQILRQPVWDMSGHSAHYRDAMFAIDDSEQPAFAKPVSCPGHLEIFRRRAASYRDLPLRYAEFGLVHRNEPSGTLHGLFRLRQFTQDDGHVFCLRAQLEAEVARFCRSLQRCYAALGFERVEVAFATRPESRAGSDADWDEAEARLSAAAAQAGLSPRHAPGAGAFYGPKLEFSLSDSAGRSWQCGTIQLDLVLPERFGVSYVEPDGGKQRPAMLHRAVLGSLERFLGVLLEHHEGRLPAWLAPEQAVVLPVSEGQADAAREAASEIAAAGVRVRIDGREESLSRRVLDAHGRAVPFLVVVGERERRGGLLTLRAGKEQRALARAEAVSELSRAVAAPL